MFDLQQALKELPDHPGVYIMKNGQGEIIYIGKAVSLKNRVKQYFQKSSTHSPKVKAMVKNIAEFEYILVDNEMEALILECNLIKKHKPRYNILLKDDKHYPYIKITVNEEYPRVMITRRVLKDGAKYFGPYSDAGAVRETLETLRKLYPVRSCSKNISYGKRIDRPCLNFHIGRCMAPCQGNVDRESYMKSINKIINFLSGKNDEIIDELNWSMNEAAEKLEFERAAAIRDEISALERILEKQKISTTTREDQDVIAFYRSTFGTCVAIFFVRGGKLLGRENFFFDDVEEDEGELLQQFVVQFYSNAVYVPKLVLLHNDVPEMETLEQYLSEKRGSKVEIRVPKRGEKSELMDMAALNAQAAFEQMRFKQIKEKQMTEGAIEELQIILDLEKLPSRIEAYDISNIQGTDPVASMVVFENGRPSNKDYRRFKIKTVEGPNDYASMREVIQRRFQRGISEREKLQQEGKDPDLGKFSKLPDLVLIDGGLGQTGIALEAMEELGLNIPVCGMVKDDRHRTRGLVYNNQEIELYRDSNAFKLVTRIQDEAHRVAIEYHRSLRTKGTMTSVLDEIKGIGKKRRLALLNSYKSIDDISKASIDELKKIDGMNEAAAKAVFDYFNIEPLTSDNDIKK